MCVCLCVRACVCEREWCGCSFIVVFDQVLGSLVFGIFSGVLILWRSFVSLDRVGCCRRLGGV